MSKAKTVLEVRIQSGVRAGEQQLFFDASELRIGRHPTADVLFPDAVVSRHHAELNAAAGRRLCTSWSIVAAPLGSMI
jgi:hypothetical protein